MAGTSRHQTLSYLMQRLASVGARPRIQHGQNFLIDLNLLRVLVDSAGLEKQDVVLEVGAGTGSLTVQLAEQAGAVVSVEIDEQLYLLASEAVEGFENVRLLRLDALRNKNNFNPAVLEAVREALAAHPGSRFKLVANLPYNVATPVLSNLLSVEPVPYSMTATIQKELAERIVAPPSTKDYSALSVWIQSQCRAEIVRLIPPSAFWPRPKVTSAIVHIVSDEGLRKRIPHREFFHHFVRSLFLHRRKFLRSVLATAYKEQLSKPDVDRIMGEVGLGENARAEELDVPKMIELCEAVRAKLSS